MQLRCVKALDIDGVNVLPPSDLFHVGMGWHAGDEYSFSAEMGAQLLAAHPTHFVRVGPEGPDEE